MKVSLRLWSLFLGAVLTVGLIGCGDKPQQQTKIVPTDGSYVDSPWEVNDEIAAANFEPTAEQIKEAKEIVAYFDAWVKIFNTSFKLPRFMKDAGQDIIFKLRFLTQKEELEAESRDVFEYSWAGDDGNEEKLKRIATITGEQGFEKKDGFVIASIGSSSTQGYYMDGEEAKGFGYDFGTSFFNTKGSLEDKNAAIEGIKEMVAKLKSIGRPVIFVNSINYATYDGYVAKPNVDDEFNPIDIKKDLPGKVPFLEKEDGKENTASMAANALVAELKTQGFAPNAYILKSAKKTKIQNKWTRTFVMELNDFLNRMGIIGDIGGGGESGKAVDNKRYFDDTKNIIYLTKEDASDKIDEYKDQKEVIAQIKKEIAASFVADPKTGKFPKIDVLKNARLNSLRRNFYAGVRNWAEENQDNPEFQKQKTFSVVVGQTGMMRALYFRSKAILKKAGQ